MQSKTVTADHELSIMTEISENDRISQRELSRKLGLSLGSINVLINKMVKEGFIKMEQVSQKQVLYMLTPVGLVEKAQKTMDYLKVHYRVITETKNRIKTVIADSEKEHDAVFVLVSDDEMGEMVRVAVDEYNLMKISKVAIIRNITGINWKDYDKPTLLHITTSYSEILWTKDYEHLKVVDLLEEL